MTIPGLTLLDSVADPTAAPAVALELRPAIVLLECGLPADETLAAFRRIRAEAPETRCLLLVEDVRQLGEADAAGADAALVKGSLPGDLIAAVERLLPLERGTGAPGLARWAAE